jgi:hypothetical protein
VIHVSYAMDLSKMNVVLELLDDARSAIPTVRSIEGLVVLDHYSFVQRAMQL